MQMLNHIWTATSINETCLRKCTFVLILTQMEAIRRCHFVYIHPHCRAGRLRISGVFFLSFFYSWCAAAATFPPPPATFLNTPPVTFHIWSYLSSALWGQPQQDLNMFACQSFLFVHKVWQVVAWDTCSRTNFQFVVVYEKLPLLWKRTHILCIQCTCRSKLFWTWFRLQFRNIGAKSPPPPNRKITRLSQPSEATQLFLLILYIFIVFPSPCDPTSLPYSSYSNHALIVQRDAFFIRLWNIERLTQHVLSHADITRMSGQGGAGQRGWSYIFVISWLIQSSINM